MGVRAEEFQKNRDIYIDYDFEEIMFRFDSKANRFFSKMYRSDIEYEVPFNDTLLKDAIASGDEIDSETYHSGKQ